MLITTAISELLYLRDRVIVPGLGGFVVKTSSAKANVITHHFTPPFKVIEFDPMLREDNDVLIQYLVEKNEQTYDEVKNQVIRFVTDTFNDIVSGKDVVLPKIGTLSYNRAQEIEFDQDLSVNYEADAFGLPDFTLPPVLRQETQNKIKEQIEQEHKIKETPMQVQNPKKTEQEDETMVKKNKRVWPWVVFPLLIVLIIISALFLYQMRSKTWNKENMEYALNNLFIFSSEEQAMEDVLVMDSIEETAAGEDEQTDLLDNLIASVIDSTLMEDTVLHQVKEPQKPADTGKADNNVSKKQYYVVGGCFSVRKNAEELIQKMKSQGYDSAQVIGKTNAGLWIVGYDAYSTEKEATLELNKIKSKHNVNAWILKQ